MSSEIIESLNDCLNKTITIKLRDKKTVEGKLQDFDQGMNLVLVESKDITSDDIIILDKIIVRGDNIVLVSLPDKSPSFDLKENASN
ncbi:MAG TPA: LSM domain-containing protein [Nitrosopumilaceae archaeon]|nr:LSM domain-containing protein [Nitrosopumilaceae archaeon]